MNTVEGIALTELTKQLNSISPERLDYFAKTLQWGTFGIDGQGQMKVRFLNDLETDHLENILVTQDHCPYLHRKTILHILKNRIAISTIAVA